MVWKEHRYEIPKIRSLIQQVMSDTCYFSKIAAFLNIKSTFDNKPDVMLTPQQLMKYEPEISLAMASHLLLYSLYVHNKK